MGGNLSGNSTGWGRHSCGGDAVGGHGAAGGGALVQVLGEDVRAEGEALGLLDDLPRLIAEINRRDESPR